MDSINTRVKNLRLEIGMTQKEFGNKIEVAQTYLSQIEKGDRPVTSKISKIICLQGWNGKVVNQEWLEKGTGEMFLELDEKDEISSYVYELLNDPDNELFILIEEIIHTYMDLKPDSKELFKDISRSILKNLKNRTANINLD